MQTNPSRSGFTLIELLIVVAIIGILASMLVPNLLDAVQKAKQKRTMADARLVGTAMMAWTTDESGAAAAAQGEVVNLDSFAPIPLTSLTAVLVPQYLQEIPPRDGWKNSFSYYMNLGDVRRLEQMAVQSAGSGGIFAGRTYTTGAFTPTDYVQDIVWTDGFFVRWPGGN